MTSYRMRAMYCEMAHADDHQVDRASIRPPGGPAKPSVPTASLWFYRATVAVLAVSATLVALAKMWPRPTKGLANNTLNPAWHSAVKVPELIAGVGVVGASIGGVLCVLGVVGAKGKRGAFMWLVVVEILLIPVAFGAWFYFVYGA